LKIEINNEKLNDHLSKVAFYYDIAGIVAGIGTADAAAETGPVSDGLVFRGAAGHSNVDSGEPMTADAVFHMASVTKLFVGTAIMMLAEKGLLDIDQTVASCLPWFRMRDNRYGKITIRQLMTHTAGLPDVSDYHWDEPETDEGALRRYVGSQEVFEAEFLWDPSEKKFSYSNIGYEILGAVIAEVSGMSFEDHVSESIFKPLGMKNSTLLTFTRDLTRISAPHYKNSHNHMVVADVYPYNRAHGPSSTLTSDISDIGRWALAHLGRKLLQEQTYGEVWKKYALVPNNGEYICLSWFAREQCGYQLFGHEGTDDGFRSSFWLCPELGVYVTVNANMTGAPVKKISKQLFDIILGNEPKL